MYIVLGIYLNADRSFSFPHCPHIKFIQAQSLILKLLIAEQQIHQMRSTVQLSFSTVLSLSWPGQSFLFDFSDFFEEKYLTEREIFFLNI